MLLPFSCIQIVGHSLGPSRFFVLTLVSLFLETCSFISSSLKTLLDHREHQRMRLMVEAFSLWWI